MISIQKTVTIIWIESFIIYETYMMEPELAAKFPEFRTYTGVGIDDPTATLRLTWTPRGIEVIVLGAARTNFVEPFEPANGSPNYITYDANALPREPWQEDLPSFTRQGGKSQEQNVIDPVAVVSSGSN